MTTENPDAVALLVEALHQTTCGLTLHAFDHHTNAAASILAHPRLARVVALGLAWVRAEEALPEGWMLGHVGLYANQTWGEGWSVHALSDGGREEVATDPSLPTALIALAEKIGGSK